MGVGYGKERSLPLPANPRTGDIHIRPDYSYMNDDVKDVPQSTEEDTIIVKNLFVIFTDDEMIKVLENCHEVRIKVGKFIIVNSCDPEAGDTDHDVTSSWLSWYSHYDTV